MAKFSQLRENYKRLFRATERKSKPEKLPDYGRGLLKEDSEV